MHEHYRYIVINHPCATYIYIYIYIYIYMSWAWKRVWKRDDEVLTLRNIWDLWHRCWQMHRQTMAVLLHMCSGFPTKILKQTIVMSLYDITRVSRATEGGNYKRRARTEPWGCYYCHLGVWTQAFGSLASQQTLYFGCLGAPRVASISRMHSVVCFSISMHPDLFGGL